MVPSATNEPATTATTTAAQTPRRENSRWRAGAGAVDDRWRGGAKGMFVLTLNRFS